MMGWIGCHLSLALLRTSIMSIRDPRPCAMNFSPQNKTAASHVVQIHTGWTKFTHFEMVYVILLNIHKRLPDRSKDVHHILQDHAEEKKTFPGPNLNPNLYP